MGWIESFLTTSFIKLIEIIRSLDDISILIIAPFFFFLEVPVYFVTLINVVKTFLEQQQRIPKQIHYYPKVSCIVAAYAEGELIMHNLRSLVEQIYPALSEIIVVIDGKENINTFNACKKFIKIYPQKANRPIKIVVKDIRGGHASSLNLGLNYATGEIIVAFDADTDCDNNAIYKITRKFVNPGVVGVAASLRPMNEKQNLLTRLQSLEYLLGSHFDRAAFGRFNAINVISGAFGAFRRSFIEKIGGWLSGAAEDLNLTLRIQAYIARHPETKIVDEPKAVGFTDVPHTLRKLLKQRMRWDGDVAYVYLLRNWRTFRPKYLGWVTWCILFFQVAFVKVGLSAVVSIFLIYTILTAPIHYTFAVFTLIYIVYFLFTAFTLIFNLLIISERKKHDLALLLYLPLMPLYLFFIRLSGFVFILMEFIFKTHRISTVAPWWVIRKSDKK